MRPANRPARFAWLAIVLVLMGYLIYGYLKADSQLSTLHLRLDESEVKLRQKKELNLQLKQLVSELNTDAYVEKMAREKLGLIEPGEIPYLTGPSGRN
ncbi:MAG: septum formation initiator family protein [Actinobacteria bacterium]|nr:septum formation initiator family protein [Actinomycetota bacterium]